MIKKYNYFVGMRITVNHASSSENTDSQTKAVISRTRDSDFMKPNQEIKASSGINKTLPGYTFQPSGGYMSRGGFVEFIRGNTSHAEVSERLE